MEMCPPVDWAAQLGPPVAERQSQRVRKAPV